MSTASAELRDKHRLKKLGIWRHPAYYSLSRMDMTEPVLLTPQGLERLKRDLEMAHVRRAEAADRMKEAAQPGDIEDNPEYEQAKEEVARLDDKIYELQEMIGRAKIIEGTKSSIIGPGSTIELEDGDGEHMTYHLVGAVESDPGAGRISIESPVGQALVGKRPGDRISVSVPVGTIDLTIIAVH
jgi:transcription elongation factor GreA